MNPMRLGWLAGRPRKSAMGQRYRWGGPRFADGFGSVSVGRIGRWGCPSSRGGGPMSEQIAIYRASRLASGDHGGIEGDHGRMIAD